MKKEVRGLLIRLQGAKTSTGKCKLRKRLRLLGHSGGLSGKEIKIRKPKQLSAAKKQEIIKYNREVSCRIESGQYRPFAGAKQDAE